MAVVIITAAAKEEVGESSVRLVCYEGHVVLGSVIYVVRERGMCMC